MEGYLYFFLKVLPVLAVTAVIFAWFGWWLRGKIPGGCVRENDVTDAPSPTFRPTEIFSFPMPVPSAVSTAGGESLGLASELWGREIAQDDLTAILGISTRIAGILTAAGVVTWRDLAGCENERLRSILKTAGARFASLDPSSWPGQATMARDGKWRELYHWQNEIRSQSAEVMKKAIPLKKSQTRNQDL
ncbi:MAG: hypothetical protein V4733_02375 [Verrucomicrobiota bacterium]